MLLNALCTSKGAHCFRIVYKEVKRMISSSFILVTTYLNMNPEQYFFGGGGFGGINKARVAKTIYVPVVNSAHSSTVQPEHRVYKEPESAPSTQPKSKPKPKPKRKAKKTVRFNTNQGRKRTAKKPVKKTQAKKIKFANF